MHCSLFEIRKPTVRDLKVTIYRNGTSRVICFISDEITTNHVDGTAGETNKGCELLV